MVYYNHIEIESQRAREVIIMMVCEFIREVRTSSTVRFAEYVEVWHVDKRKAPL